MEEIEFVNAHINSISFPKTIEELEFYIYEHGCFNVEDIIEDSKNGNTEWTVPRNSTVGDVVLFFHSVTTIQAIRKLETQTKSLDPSKHNIPLILSWLSRARLLYNQYGGKVFALGKLTTKPEYENYADDDVILHYKSRIYACIDHLYLLKNPISIDDFRSFIMLSRCSGITPLASNEFEMLRELIVVRNRDIPNYYKFCRIGNYKLSKTNKHNFLQFTQLFRKRFIHESQFRSYYVDNLLKVIAPRKHYRECNCHSTATPLARVDNVFTYKEKNYLLEVKLNILVEKNLANQLDQYIYADYIYLDTNRTKCINEYENRFMFVIDVYALYKYIPATRKIIKICDLDDFTRHRDIFTALDSVINAYENS